MTTSVVPVSIVPTHVIDEINVYNREDYNGWFETEYSKMTEPWEYSYRGAELYRHIYTVQQLKKYNARPKALLELGSSKGLMTEQLMRFCENVTASDVSVTAMKACKERCKANKNHTNCEVSYFVTTTPGLPFAANNFDVVTVCDGMEGWWFSDDTKKEALDDLYRVLKKGGIVVLTDFFTSNDNMKKFTNYENIVRNSAFSIISVRHLYDRPWYLLESVFKKMHLQKTLRSLLANVPVARSLNAIGKLFGRKMSNHIVIIAQKK